MKTNKMVVANGAFTIGRVTRRNTIQGVHPSTSAASSIFSRNVVEKGHHQPEREWQRDNAVYQRQPPPCVDEMEKGPHDHYRDHDRERWKQAKLKNGERQILADFEAGNPVAGERSHHDRDDRPKAGADEG